MTHSPTDPLSAVHSIHHLNFATYRQVHYWTREHPAERIPPPRRTEIGTVSLPASSRCVRVSAVVNIDRCSSTAAVLYTVALFYAKPTSQHCRSLAAHCYPEFFPDHFQNLVSSFSKFRENPPIRNRAPFPSNRHHRSSGDCLEGKRENYQVCSVQYCVQQLYTVNCTHIWTDLTVLWIGFCLTGPISLCLDSFVCMYYFVYDCILHSCVQCTV